MEPSWFGRLSVAWRLADTWPTADRPAAGKHFWRCFQPFLFSNISPYHSSFPARKCAHNSSFHQSTIHIQHSIFHKKQTKFQSRKWSSNSKQKSFLESIVTDMHVEKWIQQSLIDNNNIWKLIRHEWWNLKAKYNLYYTCNKKPIMITCLRQKQIQNLLKSSIQELSSKSTETPRKEPKKSNKFENMNPFRNGIAC